jgi:hypothetical protein
MASDVYGHITNCLDAERVNATRGITALLQQMAETGFAPIAEPFDPRAELISRLNIGGVVPSTATVVGLPEGSFGRAKYGLVPATQMMRLMLADMLVSAAPVATVTNTKVFSSCRTPFLHHNF